ncbi:DnaJ-domain-containing protein [Polyplosphaeria fusca]|uniref:DnaJ-domain-containing protein n=1 Tax=Polyplosphaeria fusca TaxID=682080 RepID=A0A9P4UZL0_9PLEO|nr:DnaJ-domain-containing protein [Polyplosphaeria fusca]
MGNQNHYERLGLLPGAELSAIKSAYKALALANHPDKTLHLPTAEREKRVAVFREIQNAHEVLSDPIKKELYDAQFKRSSGYAYAGSDPLKASTLAMLKRSLEFWKNLAKENTHCPVISRCCADHVRELEEKILAKEREEQMKRDKHTKAGSEQTNSSRKTANPSTSSFRPKPTRSAPQSGPAPARPDRMSSRNPPTRAPTDNIEAKVAELHRQNVVREAPNRDLPLADLTFYLKTWKEMAEDNKNDVVNHTYCLSRVRHYKFLVQMKVRDNMFDEWKRANTIAGQRWAADLAALTLDLKLWEEVAEANKDDEVCYAYCLFRVRDFEFMIKCKEEENKFEESKRAQAFTEDRRRAAEAARANADPNVPKSRRDAREKGKEGAQEQHKGAKKPCWRCGKEHDGLREWKQCVTEHAKQEDDEDSFFKTV